MKVSYEINHIDKIAPAHAGPFLIYPTEYGFADVGEYPSHWEPYHSKSPLVAYFDGRSFYNFIMPTNFVRREYYKAQYWGDFPSLPDELC